MDYFCNKQAEYILKEQYPFTQTVYIPYLDNQYKKAFWLEFLSQKEVTSKDFDCFWIPSGCNHFPGHWDIPVLTTFHDLGEYHIKINIVLQELYLEKNMYSTFDKTL